MTAPTPLAPPSPPTPEALQRLQAQLAALVPVQAAAGAPGEDGAPPPQAAPAALAAFAALEAGAEAWSARERAGWQALGRALREALADQPQVPLQAGGRGPAAREVMALLRDPATVVDEADQLDLAIRYWEAARRAGVAWSADFGEVWRRMEWTAVHDQLARLAQAGLHAAEAPVLLALAVKTATRYRELAPLLPLAERWRPGLTQQGYA